MDLPRPDRISPALQVDGLSVRWPRDAAPVLDDLSLTVERGEVVGLCGRSGSGKSTLLQSIIGLVPWFRLAAIDGRVLLDGESIQELDPGQRAHLLASCLDRPDAQLFLPTAKHELAERRRLLAGSINEAAVELLGLAPLLERPILELSSGERQRLVVAMALAASPQPVLMDEPTAFLDDAAVTALIQLLHEIPGQGGAVLLAEQAGWRLAAGTGRWLEVAGQRLHPVATPQPPALPPPPPLAEDQLVLRTRDLTVARGGRVLLRGINLELRAGEVVLLTGANGTGKSSLALTLAGLLGAHDGAVERPGGEVKLLLPSAELQLLGTTVTGELRTTGARPAELARVLRRHRLHALAARPPWTLSRGERQRLVHAALDLLRPAVMIIDEPGQGLDPQDLGQLIKLLHRRAERGRAYLLISHRQELRAAAHRHLQVSDGRLEEVG